MVDDKNTGVIRRQPFGDNPQVGQRGATTQRSILAAALEVFGEHGYHDARVELITGAAGCSRPAFYQYFGSKEEVFWRLAADLADELKRHGDALGPLGPDAGSVVAIDTWLDDLVDLYAGYRPVFVSFQAAFREDRPDGPLPRTMTRRLRDAFADAGGADGDDGFGAHATALGVALSAAIPRSIHYWLLDGDRIPRSQFTAALAATVHRSLYGPVDSVNVGPRVDTPLPSVPRPPELTVDDLPLRARGRATRQALLDAGGAVLPVRGYHDTRVDDIVSEAGFSHGSFYRYFENTEELFRVLAVDAVARMSELVGALPAAIPDGLGAWLEAWFAAYRSKGGVISAWQEVGFDDPDVATLSSDLRLVFTDGLERIVSKRGFGDTAVDAIFSMSVLEYVPYHVVVLGQLEEDDAVAAAHLLVGRGVLGTV